MVKAEPACIAEPKRRGTRRGAAKRRHARNRKHYGKHS